MQERDRILELVKKGILSTEEALVLLENIATEKDEKLVNKEASEVKKNTMTQADVEEEHVTVDDLFNSNDDMGSEEFFEKLKENERRDQERLEEILAELTEGINEVSASIDEVSIEIDGIDKDIKEKEEEITVLNTMEDLDGLTDVKKAEREQLEKDLVYLNETKVKLVDEKEELKEQLKSFKKEQKETVKDEWKSKFDIPDDWKEQANDTFNQMGEKVGEAGSQFGSFIKKTIETVTSSVNDNVDWKDINIKVPGVASQSFTHEFVYPENEATILDVKVANGKVKFTTWDKPDVKVAADIKFYGKNNAESLFEAFLERSDIEVNDEKISFQIPNKRMKVDLVFYLPKRNYDHMSVKMLNGDIKLKDLELGDIFLKTTNGEMKISNVSASMLEVEGVNGEIQVEDSKIIDFLGETVNGNVRTKADIKSISVSLINGEIRITTPADSTIKKIEASAVNGTIKVALPESIGVDGTCKTNFGNIKNRLNNIEVIREKKDRTNQSVEFRRANDDELAFVKLTTTTGSILLKDTDK
ncbi:MAG: daptomycin-sensing surface protein LiaX [Vagococcus sp.]|uniref:daptomycin-sensing surface protein LiaX n=1 Tax=Vagococcus sp. TaxID=1933889 RepID=UPI002FCC5BC9